MTPEAVSPEPATGRLGVLIVGLGAIATSLIAGVLAVRRGKGRPVGSLAMMGRVSRPDGEKDVPISRAVPLAALDDLVFGAWDIVAEDGLAAARAARVLDEDLLQALASDLQAIRPWPGIHDPRYLRNIEANNARPRQTARAAAEQIREDIHAFRRSSGAARLVLLNCASTEAWFPLDETHSNLKAFEAALDKGTDAISPSMIYAWAALKERVPVVNCTPNRCADIPALLDLANELAVPVAGRDLKTGQTLMKTILAPGLKARALGLAGWYSTNILGNRDGAVLDDPASLKAKQESKLSVLEGILQPDLYPDLYGKIEHQVHIDYYPPRRDNKEAWDNIDIFGWLDYPMQIKINFLCRDSILAAPLALDLSLFVDLAQRTGLRGAQEWLSVYFKSPTTRSGKSVHDLFEQRRAFDEALVTLAGWTAPGRTRAGRIS